MLKVSVIIVMCMYYIYIYIYIYIKALLFIKDKFVRFFLEKKISFINCLHKLHIFQTH